MLRFLTKSQVTHNTTQPTKVILRKMSDLGRKDFTDKVSESVKPNSEKSYVEKAKESVTDGADKLGKHAQPQSEKSYAQQAGDALTGNSGSHSGKTLGETAGEYVESAKNYVSDALGGNTNANNNVKK